MCFVCALCVLLLLFPERATIKQHFVETLDQYFGNVCELDLIFNFDRAYNILDECILGGYVQEPRKGVVLNSIAKQDALVEATEG